MAGSSKLKGYKGDIVQKISNGTTLSCFVAYNFGKRLMTYDEYVGYSVLCEATFMGK